MGIIPTRKYIFLIKNEKSIRDREPPEIPSRKKNQGIIPEINQGKKGVPSAKSLPRKPIETTNQMTKIIAAGWIKAQGNPKYVARYFF